MLLKNLSLIVLLSSAQALAQQQEPEIARPYFFSGPCASQGAWTQQALGLTQRIREVALQLKNDENCQAASKSMQSLLAQTQARLQEAEAAGAGNGSSAISRMSALPQEIGALRTFMSDGVKSGARQGILRTMMKKAVEYSTLTAQTGSDSGVLPKGSSLLSLGSRAHVAASNGLDNFNTLIETVSQNMQCLSAPNQGAFISAATSTLAAFANSGDSVIANKIASAVNKISVLSRDVKFAETFKQLNKAEFMTSMSCLMEITADSYCSARDGYKLFEEMNSQKSKINTEKVVALQNGWNPDSPLAGYYILTQQLPMINSWLQKVQIGIEPKLETDAQFQIKVMNNVHAFFSTVKNLQGRLNERLSFVRTLNDQNSKRLQLIEMVSMLEGQIIGNSTDSTNTGSQNFFLTGQGAQSFEIPYRLLGVSVPPEILDPRSTIREFSEWIRNDANWATIPNHNNVDALAESVSKNLDHMVESARDAAIVYYNQFFIVDKASIYLDSLLGTNFNVKESLISIDQYLARLQQKIISGKKDQSYIPAIIETRAKIGRIILYYKEVQNLAEEMKKAPRVIPVSLLNRVNQVHTNFMNEVYDKMDILLARSGWLVNRLSKFVYYDYTMALRENKDLSNYYKELYYATGYAAYDKMITMSQGGPTNVESDLKTALRVNKMNIQALEMLFRDNLVQMIAEQKLVATETAKAINECQKLMPANYKTLKGEAKVKAQGVVAECIAKYQITPAKVWADNHRRSFAEGYNAMPGESENVLVRSARAAWTSVRDLLVEPATRLSVGTEKYDMPTGSQAIFNLSRQIKPMDDEAQSSKYLTARLCVQSLAFLDLKSYWHLCKDVTLESDFKVPAQLSALKDVDAGYFQVNFAEKAYEQVERPDLNHSNRICAFRDFYRRNQVAYLTMGMQNSENYEPGYTTEEHEVVRVQGETPAQGEASVKDAAGKAEGKSGKSSRK